MDAVTATDRYVPPHPPRGAGPVPVWRGFFGERGRNTVFGWSERAFETQHIRRQIFRFTVHVPLDPDAVQRVLQTNAANYAKPDIVKKLIAPMVGQGLLSSDGELWRGQRRIVAGNFTPPAVDALIPAFGSAAAERMAGWRPGDIDMAAEATGTTMAIIADTLFGGDPRLKTRAAMEHIAAALAIGGEARLTAMLGLPLLAWNRRMRAGKEGLRFLRRTLAEVVRDRLPDGGDDFLGKLVRELGERFEADQAFDLAVDNTATFFLAGHETTSNALAWTLFLLSEQLAIQDDVAAEARRALDGGTDDPALPDRLPLLRRVLEEALRLYPPAPRFDRQAVGPDRLGDVEIAAGDLVSIWPWLLHRHKALWDDPDVFDPDRFLPERKEEMHRFQYIPFGGGPRVCVGARFSMVEAMTILARWLADWRFEPVPRHVVKPVGTVTLRPEGGLPLRLVRRD